MDRASLLKWFDELHAEAGRLPVIGPGAGGALYYQPQEAHDWLARARVALHSAFPPAHPIHREWDGVFERAKTRTYVGFGNKPVPLTAHNVAVHLLSAVGVFSGALQLLQQGHVDSLFDTARAETVGEVLDQAGALSQGGYLAASTVLAGGALETHLLHLCTKADLTWNGDGSIEKYNGAIAKARNEGKVEVYSANDTKLVTAWGGMRNKAAHDPTEFNFSAAEVRALITGVREFISRVP